MSDSFSKKTSRQVWAMISSLASIELPNNERSRVLFYLALTSKDNNQRYFADELFKKSKEQTIDPHLKVENIYFSALIPFRQGRYQEASRRMEQVLNIETKSTVDYRNYARLNLARIAVMEDHLKTAITYLSSIPEDSPAYKDGLYELILLNYKVKDYEEALAKATTYLSRFKDHRNADKVLHIKGLLELKTGRVNESRNSLQSQQNKLKEFEEWLQRNYSGVNKITYFDINRISAKGRFVADPPYAFLIAGKHHQKINRLVKRLDDIRSEIRSMVYFLGSLNPSQYNPQWAQQASHIEKLAENAFDLGDHLLNIQADFYNDRLTASLRQKLDRSRKRRKELYNRNQRHYYQRGRWESWVTINQHLMKLGKTHEKLHKVTADIANIHFNHQTDRDIDILEESKDRAHRLIQSANRAVELVRARAIRDLANQSKHLAVKRFILEYSQIIYEESILMGKIRDHYSQPNEQHMSRDLEHAWQKWEYVVKALYQNIVSLDTEVREGIETRLNRLEYYVSHYQKLKSDLISLRQRIESSLGQDSFPLLSHYLSNLKKKESEILKWQADNQWRDYTRISKDREKVETKNTSKLIKMEEDLRDLEYEVKR